MSTLLAEPRTTDGPYVGPRPFDPEERALFFGRGQEAQALASLIVAHRVVLLYAASGAGKTSLLNAGVIPLLAEEDGFEVLPPVRLRGLAAASDLENPFIANVIANLARSLGTPAADPATLTEFLAARPAPLVDDALPAPRALIMDQFEELFTLYPERWPERRDVFVQISDALEADPLLRVVLALREDYVAQLDPFAALLPTKLRTRMRLESLRRPAALEAIKGPLAEEQRTFADGAAERLVDDLLRVRIHARGEEQPELLGETVEPVQLQVICRTLWASLPPEVEEIGEADLARIGSVSDVLSDYYREAVQAAAIAGGLHEPELRDRLEAAFITPVGTRGTVVGGDAETAGIPNAAIAELEARHLVRAEWRAGARWFELTHDSLVGPIVASNAELRQRREARRVRRLQRVVAGLVSLAVGLVAVVLLVTRDEEKKPVPRQTVGVLKSGGAFAKLRLKQTLRASAAPVGVRFLAGGRGLAVASGDGRVRVWDINLGREIDTLDYQDNGLFSLDVNPKTRDITVTGRSGMKTWRTSGIGSRPPEFIRFSTDTGSGERGTADGITSAAFSRDGRWMIVVRDGHARLMSRGGGSESPQRPFTPAVARVSYSPDGTMVAGITPDGAVLLRNLAAGDVAASPVGRERPVRATGAIVAAAFSSDGQTLVTASTDGAARLWQTSDGTLLRSLPGDGAALTDAQLSSDGRYVVTAARNGLVRVFSVSGRQLAVVRASTRIVTAVATAAAGRVLVTADSDGVVRTWAVVTPVRPFNTSRCSANRYYAPLDSGSAAVCSVPAGTPVRAPEAGTVQDAGARVTLTTADGRVWRFASIGTPHGHSARLVAAGDVIGTASDPIRGVAIELWQNARGAHRLLDRWNPLLFLDLDTPRAAPGYPGDDAPQVSIAQWMAAMARAASLPPELPVMAALVESGLKNLRVDEADSVGYFAMRVGIWNQGAYAGYPDNPELQVKWFLDQAEAVKRQRLAAGKSIGDPNGYGEWVADVERPAEQLRGSYQLKLDEARSLFSERGAAPAAAAPAAAVPADPAAAAPAAAAPAAPAQAAPVAEAVEPPAAAPAESAAEPGTTSVPCKPCPAGAAGRAAAAALSARGKPYLSGGTSPQTGFDASGLVLWAFARADIHIPWPAELQARTGTPVGRSQLKRGDIVLFANRAGEIYHVGLYLESGRFVHVASKEGVTVASLDEAPWDQRFSGGRHIG